MKQKKQNIRKFIYIGALILLSLSGVIYFSNASKLSQKTTDQPDKPKNPLLRVYKSATVNCSNLFTDEENKISFCLPSNYLKVSNEKKVTFSIASFTPIQNSFCSAPSGAYCYVLFFNYYTGDTEAPPKRAPSADIFRIDKTFQTEAGEIMTIFSPYSPSIGENIYSYKLKNGRYAYFDFITGHPKQNANELNNHLRILKSVKQI